MSQQHVRILDCGDSALRVVAANEDAEKNWELVHSLSRWLREYDAPGLRGVVPTYDSTLIEFDPEITDHENLRYLISLRLETTENTVGVKENSSARTFRIPVAFGNEYGPDLISTAAGLNMTTREVIDLACSIGLRIRCLAQAGAPMVDGPPFPAPVPRRQDPRTTVPAGSVAFAGVQGIIIPTPAPCGWQILGRTPSKLVDAGSSPILVHQPGDIFNYFEISPGDWEKYSGPIEPHHAE